MRRNMRDESRDPYAAARVTLADGTELSGADGLQVWMARLERKLADSKGAQG